MRMSFKEAIILFVLILLLPGSPLAKDGALQKYDMAKTAYFNREYRKAEKLLLELLADKPDNGYLKYNLGNVYFKLGELGRAIQYYEKARRTVPRLTDLRINLDYAKTKRVDEITESFSDYLNGTFYFWSGYLTIWEFRAVLVFASILFWGMCLWLFWRQRKIILTRTILGFLIFAYLVAGYWIKSNLEAPGRFGIVLNPEVDVKASYLDTDESLFQLHEGTRVRIIDLQRFGEDKTWFRIALPEGQKGWVRGSEIGVI